MVNIIFIILIVTRSLSLQTDLWTDGKHEAGVMCARRTQIKITPVGAALGAEVSGLDIGKHVSFQDLNTIKTAFAEHLVLIFKNQSITPQQQIYFTSYWGKVEPHPIGSRADTHPTNIPKEIMVVQNNPASNIKGLKNNFWHSDVTFVERPPALSVLYALDVPNRYGDTMFANGYLGFEDLSLGLKELLMPLRSVHTSKWFEKNRYKASVTTYAPDVIHPVVRTHPITGKLSLYIIDNYMERFENMTVEESERIKRFLLSWLTRPENVYRHRWSKGDLVMWDNRATLHYGVFDYGADMTRVMHRTTASGERPV